MRYTRNGILPRRCHTTPPSAHVGDSGDAANICALRWQMAFAAGVAYATSAARRYASKASCDLSPSAACYTRAVDVCLALRIRF